VSLATISIMVAAQLGVAGAPTLSPSIQCTALGGHYRLIQLLGSTTYLSAQVHVKQREPGLKAVGEWSPAAGLLFILPRKQHTAGVQVYIESSNPEVLKILIRKPDGATTDFAEAPAGNTVPVSVRAENGVLTVSAGTIHQTIKLDATTIKGAALMCSSGTFEFALDPGLRVDPSTLEDSFDPWEKETK